MKIRIETCSKNDRWREFVCGQRGATVFFLPEFIRVESEQPAYLYFYKGGELLAGAALPISPCGKQVLYGGMVYGGVIFSDLLKSFSVSRKASSEYHVLENFAEYLAENFDSVFLQLSPSIVDIRPFLWVNYGRDGARFKESVRYTCAVDRQTFHEREFSELRRREIRKAERKGGVVRVDGSVDELCRVVRETFSRQNVPWSELEDEQLRQRVTDLKNGGYCRIYLGIADGEISAALAFASVGETSVYLYGGQVPESRSSGIGTLLMSTAIAEEFKNGARFADLEGANSPQRGAFKMSFGARLEPYYRLELVSE